MQPHPTSSVTPQPRRPSQSSLPLQLRINTNYNVRRNPSVSSSNISRSNTGASRKDLSTTTTSPITPCSQGQPYSYQKTTPQRGSPYTSLLRKQSGTVWCDRAQPVESAKLNAKHLARQKAMAAIDTWKGRSKSASGLYVDNGSGSMTYALRGNVNMIGAAAPTTMLGSLMGTDTRVGDQP